MTYLEEHQLKLGDTIEIVQISGKKTKLKLNRTKYEILLQRNCNCRIEGTKIILPTFGKDRRLGAIHLEKFNDKSSTYIGVFNEPIKANGVYCSNFYLSKSIELFIDYNLLKAVKEDSNYVLSSGLLEKVSPLFLKSNLPILIEGDTGTGKTTLAREIHELEGRAGNFVHINISDFAHNLVESELFGHVKGSFTGAVNEKKGSLHEARFGTLFLDEIDSLPKVIQSKLLLFLDDFSFRPVGSLKKENVSLRLILASGSCLREKVKNREIRSDFFFRVSAGLKLKLHSLKDDPEQISTFIKRFEKDKSVTCEKSYCNFLLEQDWPGNFRQLKAHLTLKLIYSKSGIFVYDEIDEQLQTTSVFNSDFNGGLESLEEVKKKYIVHAYRSLGNSVVKTADVLDVAPNTVRSYLKTQLKVVGI